MKYFIIFCGKFPNWLSNFVIFIKSNYVPILEEKRGILLYWLVRSPIGEKSWYKWRLSSPRVALCVMMRHWSMKSAPLIQFSVSPICVRMPKCHNICSKSYKTNHSEKFPRKHNNLLMLQCFSSKIKQTNKNCNKSKHQLSCQTVQTSPDFLLAIHISSQGSYYDVRNVKLGW